MLKSVGQSADIIGMNNLHPVEKRARQKNAVSIYLDDPLLERIDAYVHEVTQGEVDVPFGRSTAARRLIKAGLAALARERK